MIEEVEAGRLTDRAIEAVLRKAGRVDARRLMHLLSKGENTRRVHDLIRETVKNFAAPYLITQEADWNRLPDLPLLNDLELHGSIAVFESLRFDDKRIMNALDKNRRNSAKTTGTASSPMACRCGSCRGRRRTTRRISRASCWLRTPH